AGLFRRPAGVAGIAVAYGLYQLVLVVTETRLQERIEGPARATVTSLAALGTEITCLVLYAVWATGRPALLVVISLVMAAGLPALLRHARPDPATVS
ncbi:MAG: MFS transporter, partial [Actinomycetota bacterium]|nr:MFS transporter [Actinomycetota bacterium]